MDKLLKTSRRYRLWNFVYLGSSLFAMVYMMILVISLLLNTIKLDNFILVILSIQLSALVLRMLKDIYYESICTIIENEIKGVADYISRETMYVKTKKLKTKEHNCFCFKVQIYTERNNPFIQKVMDGLEEKRQEIEETLDMHIVLLCEGRAMKRITE